MQPVRTALSARRTLKDIRQLRLSLPGKTAGTDRDAAPRPATGAAHAPAVEKPAAKDYQAAMRRPSQPPWSLKREILLLSPDPDRYEPHPQWLESENAKCPSRADLPAPSNQPALALGIPELNGYWLEDRHQASAIHIGFGSHCAREFDRASHSQHG
jgi:hypothetical protein